MTSYRIEVKVLNFIVLGLVPGTNIQITFTMFLVIVAISSLVVLVIYEVWRHKVIAQLSLKLAKATSYLLLPFHR